MFLQSCYTLALARHKTQMAVANKLHVVCIGVHCTALRGSVRHPRNLAHPDKLFQFRNKSLDHSGYAFAAIKGLNLLRATQDDSESDVCTYTVCFPVNSASPLSLFPDLTFTPLNISLSLNHSYSCVSPSMASPVTCVWGARPHTSSHPEGRGPTD